MAKKFGFDPFILLSGTPGDDTVTGGGSGQGGVTVTATPMSYADWLNSDWKDDFILDGTIDANDYAAWWEYCGFSEDDWRRLNGEDGPQWDDYF